MNNLLPKNLVIRMFVYYPPWNFIFNLKCLELQENSIKALYIQHEDDEFLDCKELEEILKLQAVYDLQLENLEDEYFLSNIKVQLEHIQHSIYGMELVFKPFGHNNSFFDILNENKIL